MVSMNSYFFSQLTTLNKESAKLSYQSASGEKLRYGSDDSVSFAKILNAKQNITTYENLQANLTNTGIFNTASDSSIAEIKTAAEAVKSEILKAISATMSSSEYPSMATNLEGIKDTLLMLANEKVNGQYLFSGSDTTVQPFVKDSVTGVVTYAGNTESKMIAVEKNTYSEQGVNGLDIFYYDSDGDGTSDRSYFDDLDEVINALNGYDSSGNSISSSEITDILRAKLDDMNMGYDSMNVAHSVLGSRNLIFENAAEHISTKILNYKTMESTYADADLTEVAVRMKSLELIYTSLYSTISKLNNLSLVNFIK